MSPEAVLLLVLVAVALGYVAGRTDRIDLGPLRGIGRGFGDREPGASAPGPRRSTPPAPIRLRRRRPGRQSLARLVPVSARPPGQSSRERD